MFFFVLSVCLFVKAQNGPPLVSLGNLQMTSIVVNDLGAAVAQWSAGTGSQFYNITTTSYIVFLPDQTPIKVTLQSATTVHSNPILELVKATPAVGPWAPQTGPGGAPGHLVYVVPNVHQVDFTMQNSGLTRVAFSGNNFAFYQADNGVLVKVITQDLLPPVGGVNVPQAPFDLGAIVHVDISVQEFYPLKAQFSKLFSLNWIQIDFPNSPINFTDGVQYVDIKLAAADSNPVIELEGITPALGVFTNSFSSYNLHPSYAVPPGTVSAAMAQMLAANFTLNTYVSITGIGPVLSFFTTPQNFWIEIVDEDFDI